VALSEEVILWHFLSKERLQQKIKYAEANKGKFLLTQPKPEKDISNGKLSEFIYCLPHIISGADFCDDGELTVIKIELFKDVKIYRYAGDPDNIPYKDVKKDFDIIDMVIESSLKWPIRFRQCLLINARSIKNWSYDIEISHAAFKKEYFALQNGCITSNHFFLCDLSVREQMAYASLLALNLGISLNDAIPEAEARSIVGIKEGLE